MNTVDVRALLRSLVGPESSFVEDIARATATGYPPYNVLEVDGGYQIQVAAAGFKKTELDVSLIDGVLHVNGTRSKDDSQDTTADNTVHVNKSQPRFVHKGIAGRDFALKWQLTGNISVATADFVDGILTITLAKKIDHKKIVIGAPAPRQVLMEEDGA